MIQLGTDCKETNQRKTSVPSFNVNMQNVSTTYLFIEVFLLIRYHYYSLCLSIKPWTSGSTNHLQNISNRIIHIP